MTLVDNQYEVLLKRAYEQIRRINPEFDAPSRGIVVKPPSLTLEARVTVWHNFGEICQTLRRQPDHFSAYIFADWSTTGSIDADKRLIIKGRFREGHVQGVIRSYVNTYVKCSVCHQLDTSIIRENRLSYLVCNKCHSKVSVQSIARGFEAQIGKRPKNKI